MKNNRIKLKAPTIKSREEIEALVGDLARLTNFQQQTTALMDQRITEVRAEYETQLAEAEQQKAALMEAARQWAEANPEEFGKTKSIEMLHGTMGCRIGMPTLKTLSGWTWDRVLEKLRTVPAYAVFIRTKQEVDKATILDLREDLLDGDLRAMGVRVVQDETFFVEPKLTEVETKATA